jgi:hypothetical protein
MFVCFLLFDAIYDGGLVQSLARRYSRGRSTQSQKG